MIERAYNIEIAKRPSARIAEDADHGWVFGLPRGITTEQWPLDPVTGAPLAHAFTLLLPRDYRCFGTAEDGSELVGFAFFGTPADANDGGAGWSETLSRVILEPGDDPPDDTLAPYWRIARSQHPRLRRMTDILDYHYAMIPLTREELASDAAQPPSVPVLHGSEPFWRTRGALSAFLNGEIGPDPVIPPAEHYVAKVLVWPAPEGLDAHLALRWSPRADDPNAGIVPAEPFGEDSVAETGYTMHYYWEGGRIETEAYREQPWVADHAPNHIGGTMRPVQGIPLDFSPYHIGFEEWLGGFNFGGGGNAQLDFKNARFDWSTG